MASPTASAVTSSFVLSGNTSIDPLLNETLVKWGSGSGASLSYSFPWVNGQVATYQSNYSDKNEPNATQHSGFNGAQIAAAQLALQKWANIANITFVETSDTSTNVGDIRFAFSSAVSADSWGWGYYPNDSWPGGGDIWVNPSHSTETAWSAGDYNLLALEHEIGHALGLKHPGNYNGSSTGSPPFVDASLDYRNYSIMSYNNPANIYPSAGDVNGKYGWLSYYIFPDAPMVLDIAAIQYLYGANTTYHSGNDTYSFDPAKPFYQSIWDGAGVDAISVVNFSQSCDIDLVPGHYSSIRFGPPADNGGVAVTYTGASDLGIAYNCIIENAIGGSGNDILIGNDVGNMLTGNDGDDTITGGKGNDTIDGGNGSDTAKYTGAVANYTVTYNAATVTYTITDSVAGRDGVDSLINIENLQFSDGVRTPASLVGSSPVVVSALSKAKVYLGAGGDHFTLSDSGITLNGGAGNDVVKIASGVAAIRNDANIERIELTGNLADYKFVCVSGTGVQVQSSSGAVVDTIPSLNQDTTLAFANGSAVLAQTGAVTFSLGGQAISTVSATALAVTLNAVDTSATAFSGSSKARVYMGAGGDRVVLADSGVSLNGGTGSDVIKIGAGVSGIRIDANVERIELTGNLADYKFASVAGVGVQVQSSAGVVVGTVPSLNQDTALVFANGSTSLQQTGATTFTLGGQQISAGAAASLTITLNSADKPSLALDVGVVGVPALPDAGLGI